MSKTLWISVAVFAGLNVSVEAQEGQNRLSVQGTVWERYRNDVNANTSSPSYGSSVTYGTLMAKYRFADRFSAYARLGGQLVSTGGLGRDFNTAFYRNSDQLGGALAVDQWGLIYEDSPAGWYAVLGRQARPLDVSSTIYDQSWKVGLHSFFDGLYVRKTAGKATIELNLLSEDEYRLIDNVGTDTRSDIYALRARYQLTPQLQIGGLYGTFRSSLVNQSAGIPETTNTEFEAVWKPFPKVTITGEWAKSSAMERNELSFGSVAYQLTAKDRLTALTYRIGDYSTLGSGSAFPVGNDGQRYFWDHAFNSRVSLQVYHEVDHQIYGSGNATSDQVTLSYKF